MVFDPTAVLERRGAPYHEHLYRNIDAYYSAIVSRISPALSQKKLLEFRRAYPQ